MGGMDDAYTKTPAEALKNFQVKESRGLSAQQVKSSRDKHGRNALPEDPPTPIWQLILEQFKDQLVVILLGSAAVSFVLALFDQEEGWTAFVDPAVVSLPTSCVCTVCCRAGADCMASLDPDHPHSQCRCRRLARNQCRKGDCRAPGILGQRGQSCS